jgi:hypothetical protein
MKGKEKEYGAAGKQRPLSPSRVRVERWAGMAVELYLKGYSQDKVTELMKEATGGHSFSNKTINQYIQKAVKSWQQSKDEMISTWKAEQLEKINLLETTYWEAWQKSLLTVKTNSKKQTKTEAGGMSLAEKREQERQSQGEVRFLQGIQWCIEQRCKILGVEVPPAVLINNTNNNVAVSSNVSVSNRTVIFNGRTIRTSQEIKEAEEEN